MSDPMMSDDGTAQFGGGNEEGPICTRCERRSTTPFCPWCGMRKDDAPASLLAYLERMVGKMEREAETRRQTTAKRKRETAREESQDEADRVERNGLHIAAHKQETADRYGAWAAWVRKAMGRTAPAREG